jgi:1-acyl-sn-glycerol-3-phosphate acyltransferase
VSPPGQPAIDHGFLTRTAFPLLRLLIRAGWFDFSVEGVEHLPREGPLVLALNHAGWFPLDALFVTLAMAEAQGLSRAPFFATHEAALEAPGLGAILRRAGAVPATWFRRPEKLPPEIQCCGIFPEGVRGNTKPFWEAYRMRPWNRGFVRVAIARRAPIVPTAVLGGEEALPVGWTVKVLAPLIGSELGLPLSLVPLPARWKVVFHAPVVLEVGQEAIADSAYCSGVAARVQETVQATLDREAAARPLHRLSSAWSRLRRGPAGG